MGWLVNSCSCADRSSARGLFEIRDLNSRASDRRSLLMRCEACGALYPRDTPTGEAASTAYARYYTRAKPRGLPRAWLLGLLNWTRGRYLDRGTPAEARSILDFGCGAGAYLARFEDRTCFGIDPNPPGRPPAGFAWLDLDDLEAAAPCDWVTLGHVLEHLAKPADVLSRLAEALSPGGGLWIATPNADSFLFAAAGPWARDIDFPRHREIFSRRALERLAAGVGLTCQFASPPRLNAVLNAAATIRNILRDRAGGRAARMGAAVRTALGLAVHVAQGRARRDRRSPELVVICRLDQATRRESRL